VRYSLATFRSIEMEKEAALAATTAEFEQRIAAAMAKQGIAYFGRLVMKVNVHIYIYVYMYMCI